MNKTLTLALAVLLGLSACTVERVSNFPSYKLKVIQGNELDPRAVVSLQPSMSRDQVQLLLGTPLLRDPFHKDRWDYVFTITRNGVTKDLTSLTLYFQNDQLVKAEGDAIQQAIKKLQEEQGQSNADTTAPATANTAEVETTAEPSTVPQPLWRATQQ